MIKAIFVLILIVLGTLYIPEDIRKEVRESIYQSYTLVKDLFSTDPHEKVDKYNRDSLENSSFKGKNLVEKGIVAKDFFESGSEFDDIKGKQGNDNTKGQDINGLQGKKDTTLLQGEEARQREDYQTFMKFYKRMNHKLSHVNKILEDTHDKK